MAAANYELQSDFARKYFFEGKAEGEARGEARGEAKMLLRIIALRGVDLSDAERQRILACTDDDQLGRWAARALTARTSAEILES